MPEGKIIPTYTTLAAVVPDVDITTYYLDPLIGDILNVFINGAYQIFNGYPLSEGYGVVIGTDNFLVDIDIDVDVNGFLVAFGAEANNYDIDSDGNLTYTT